MHTYLDPHHSLFRFGLITAEVEFGGDVHDAETADIQAWRFSMAGTDPGEFTKSIEAMEDFMTDGGLAMALRGRHCPRAARDLGR